MNHRLNQPFTKNGFQKELEERKTLRKIKQFLSFLANSANHVRLSILGFYYKSQNKNLDGNAIVKKPFQKT